MGEKAGETYVYLNPTNSGDHRVFASPKRVAQGLVPQVTIDEAVAHCGLPNFIKIDTQGYELACLRGAAATIQRSPRMEILAEYYPLGIKAAGFEEQDFFDALASYGFDLFLMNRKTGPVPVDAVQIIALLAGSRCDHTNILCRRKR